MIITQVEKPLKEVSELEKHIDGLSQAPQLCIVPKEHRSKFITSRRDCFELKQLAVKKNILITLM